VRLTGLVVDDGPHTESVKVFRAGYALGKGNLAAIHRIVSSKYQRGAAFANWSEKRQLHVSRLELGDLLEAIMIR
jgi:hypothetical protein